MKDAPRPPCLRPPAPAMPRRAAARALAICLGLCLLIASALTRAADTEGHGPLERDIKAAYLYKFLGYVEWPPSALPRPGSPFVIGVVGADDIADELARIIAGRSVHNRGVRLKRIKGGEPLADVHLLFIGRGDAAREVQLLQMLQRQPVLTVTESESGFASGSIINFRLADSRVRFEVSLAAAERSNLKLSSRLLSVAASVQGNAR